jgi:hypothetical protein
VVAYYLHEFALASRTCQSTLCSVPLITALMTVDTLALESSEIRHSGCMDAQFVRLDHAAESRIRIKYVFGFRSHSKCQACGFGSWKLTPNLHQGVRGGAGNIRMYE